MQNICSKTLRQDGEFILYRGQHRRHTNTSPPSILTVTPVSERPALGSLRRMEHEYALRAELDPAWAVRPLALTRHNGREMLILTDPGGEPLDRRLGSPMALTQCLRLAIGLAAALRHLHGRGLIHKDIKPAHVLINWATAQVWLMGFGIASRLPRERQSPEPPECIAGTLAYMAPEQTGRMNRSVDSRSDLYALGVTLYEMLTGMLPFTATDAMEWVHCHIARQPVSPRERVPEVPAPVSAIIVKLLAKTVEERFQTAAGVEADLRRCLTAWESRKRIDTFTLAAHDRSDRLVMPERLYGREREVHTLLDAFEQVVAGGAPALVLVSGYSGIGKSSVVQELHKAIVLPRGIFIAGKFDQYKRDIPYATLAQAFQSADPPDPEHKQRGSRPLAGGYPGSGGRAWPAHGQPDPGLVWLIGKQPPMLELPPQEAEHRFHMVFRAFLGAFARKEHPLALFLDDLQWLDAATLKLIEHLMTHPDTQHLLVIGAFRDNEVSPTHPLMQTLAAMRQTQATVHDIVLAPLSLTDVTAFVADTLHCAHTVAEPLARLVHQKTLGNPFFAIQFLTALHEEHLLAFDASAALWRWDLDRIRPGASRTTSSTSWSASWAVTSRHPVLKQLACLGNSADIATLALVTGLAAAVRADLWEAVPS